MGAGADGGVLREHRRADSGVGEARHPTTLGDCSIVVEGRSAGRCDREARRAVVRDGTVGLEIGVDLALHSGCACEEFVDGRVDDHEVVGWRCWSSSDGDDAECGEDADQEGAEQFG